MAPANKSGVISAGSAAWKKVIGNPLRRRKGDAGEVGSDSSNDAESANSITSIIESEIVPRLLMVHSFGPMTKQGDQKGSIAATDADRFAALPLELEAAGLLAEVEKFLDDGASIDAVCVDLLAPAARRLGEMWEADECDFIDVTMGLWRLQEVMRDIAARNPAIISALETPQRVLVTTMPGDQHTFGAQLIDEVFARSGWRSHLLPSPQRRELLDAVSQKPFDLVALTICRDCPSAAISSLIRSIRGVSANPDLSILIGGHAVNKNPSMVSEVGADGTGSDARAALDMAEQLVTPVTAHAQISR